jgi:hypothetical protein
MAPACADSETMTSEMRPMPQKSREFFYRGKDGKPQDKDLHEPILSGISREAEARSREFGKKYARKAGLTEDEINLLYADPNESQEQEDFTEQKPNVIQQRVEEDSANDSVPFEDKFTRPLGLSPDGKTMNVFPSLEEAQEHINKHSTVIVVDENGNETELPIPGLDGK